MIIKGTSRTAIMSISEMRSVESSADLQRSLEKCEFDRLFICAERINSRDAQDFMISLLIGMSAVIETPKITELIDIQIINCPKRFKKMMHLWCDTHRFHLNECVTCPTSYSSLVNALDICIMHPCINLSYNYFCLE